MYLLSSPKSEMFSAQDVGFSTMSDVKILISHTIILHFILNDKYIKYQKIIVYFKQSFKRIIKRFYLKLESMTKNNNTTIK